MSSFYRSKLSTTGTSERVRQFSPSLSNAIQHVAHVRRTATATFRIVLDNVNDNPPTLTLSTTSSSSTVGTFDVFFNSSSQAIEVSEALPIGTILAAITVSDADEVDGAKIACGLEGDRIDHQIFHLEFLESGLMLSIDLYLLKALILKNFRIFNHSKFLKI